MPQLRIKRVDRPPGSAARPVSRLRRFPENRFIGRRDTMVVFDCDDPVQFADLSTSIEQDGLDIRDELQSFAPDTRDEARNRGFKSNSQPRLIAN